MAGNLNPFKVFHTLPMWTQLPSMLRKEVQIIQLLFIYYSHATSMQRDGKCLNCPTNHISTISPYPYPFIALGSIIAVLFFSSFSFFFLVTVVYPVSRMCKVRLLLFTALYLVVRACRFPGGGMRVFVLRLPAHCWKCVALMKV